MLGGNGARSRGSGVSDIWQSPAEYSTKITFVCSSKKGSWLMNLTTAQMDQEEEQDHEALEETCVGEEQDMAGSLLAFVSLQLRVFKDLLFSVFINDTDSGTECTLSRFVGDTKVSGATDSLEQRDAIQRDPDRLEECAHENLTRFNTTKCKVLHLSQSNPRYLQWDMNALRSPRRTLGTG
ncbi:hypothetical protein WISP_89255 [Willisornis vidua]|uniref:Rna-directed dna polymerase from mobile element jockey-like n=1 Tax=Willisornis vidua TaxID=1566151 RepID=A0ABQ9D216_9PASS|nr:hypothetical protein WISP_89255 [Willisornis vidua]